MWYDFILLAHIPILYNMIQYLQNILILITFYIFLIIINSKSTSFLPSISPKASQIVFSFPTLFTYDWFPTEHQKMIFKIN